MKIYKITKERGLIMFTELIKGDCMAEMDKLISKGVKFDAIITDPPSPICCFILK